MLDLLAGNIGGAGNVDGPGTAARFNAPTGAAVDSAGNVYIADRNNQTIRKITAAGVVTTLAGAAGLGGSVDGPGATARFNAPVGVAVDGAGTVYVADQNNQTIRKITAAGVVTTLAGVAGLAGSADGAGATARFRNPRGVAVDSSGTVYVADQTNDTIRRITAAGVVTTLAGTALSPGSVDGTGAAALFNAPAGVAVDVFSNVYVADLNNDTIRRITSAGVVTTLAGTAGIRGSADGAGNAALFSAPAGLAIDSARNIYVADQSNHTIRTITAAGSVTTLAGSAGSFGSADGAGPAARFASPAGMAVDSTGNVYVADTSNETIRKVTAAGDVTTLAGAVPMIGSADGMGATARFSSSCSVAVDSAGTAYVADQNNDTIRKVTAAGVVTTLAGTAGAVGSTDGAGAMARFNRPTGVAVDSAGNVYVADQNNHTIRKITAAGVVTTLAGAAGMPGSADGAGAAARFHSPFGVAVDSAGSVYVADQSNQTIRKITAAGVVTTLAGAAGMAGRADGAGAAARFNSPAGVAVDSAGNLYVADQSNDTIRKVTAAGVVTTLAGGGFGSADGTGAAARFNRPTGVAVDSAGNVYVADQDNSTVREVTPAGVVTTIAGMAGMKGIVLGATPRLFAPASLALAGDSIVLSDGAAILVLHRGG